jgi:formylglycine-generating enzyme required for sulfatase activity
LPVPEQRIGRYETLSQLGHGGMAVVYLARDPFMKRQVAVKVLPQQFTFDPQFRARFDREAEIIANLQDAAIVPVHDYGEHEGQPYIVMRYMPGGSLRERAAGRALPLAEVAHILQRLAPALDKAHRRGIIHRDLKPDNILFDDEGEPFLSDFGIAKILEASGALTGTSLIGTPAYMSPEQARAARNLDGRTDVYSLGVIVFQLLTGQLPYHADTPMGLAVAHINDPIPSILSVKPDLPPASEGVMRRALAKDRDQRYATAAELTRAVGAIAEGQAAKTTMAVNEVQVVEPPATGAGATVLEPRASTAVPPALAAPPAANTAPPAIVEPAVSPTTPAPLVPPPAPADTPQAVTAPPVTAGAASPPPRAKRRSRLWGFGLAGVGAGVVACALLVVGGLIALPRLLPALPFRPLVTPVATQLSELGDTVMVFVPAGTFEMGSDSGQDDEQPSHTVYLDDFWIDRTEVTNGMYLVCVVAGECEAPRYTSSATRVSYYRNPAFYDYPVVNISWDDASDYCAAFGRRLPTEAEWEKAARGTDQRTYPWGNDTPLPNLLNSAKFTGDTSEVGIYLGGASPYGALDMAGNVFEYVADWYDSDYYSASPVQNPLAPSSGEFRAVRGGSWISPPNAVEVVSRSIGIPGVVDGTTGFRCARTP